MKDYRTRAVINVCCFHVQNGCAEVCPLADACIYIEGESVHDFQERLNTAAFKHKIETGLKNDRENTERNS